ncbi:MAG: hypothetical protein GXO66_07295 [Euryarchaeota archaeon]|nr:hypothetical protein [Euryarchaeota archaeon]
MYYSFFYFNGEVHAAVNPGFPVFAAPLYLLLERKGVFLYNLLLNLAAAYVLFRMAEVKFGREYGLFSALGYVFFTPSMFYASSMWHHTSVTFFFLLSQYIFLKLVPRRRDVLLLSASSAAAVMCAYYMVLPVGVILVAAALRLPASLRLLLLFSFAILLLPSVAYNYFNYGDPLTGKYSVPGAGLGDSLAGVQRSVERFILSGVAVVIAVEASREYNYWNSFVQKSLLQSSPVLALGLIYPFLARRDLRFAALSAANLLLLLMVVRANGDYGGWQLNMRYLLPLFPFLVLGTAGFLHRLGIQPPIRRLLPVLLLMAAAVLAFPVGINEDLYQHIKLLTAFSGVFVLVVTAGVLVRRVRVSTFKAAVLFLMLLSAFVNLNDASYGASYRSAHLLIENSLSLSPGERVAFPEEFSIVLPENEVVFYSGGEAGGVLRGNLTLVATGSFSPEVCRVVEQRSFNNLYYFLVRDNYLSERLREAGGRYRVLKLRCPRE